MVSINKVVTPPIKSCCSNLSKSKSISPFTPWINKQTGRWMVGDKDTGVDAHGKAGASPYIGDNGNWFINGVDLGVPASGTVDMPAPQTDEDIFY